MKIKITLLFIISLTLVIANCKTQKPKSQEEVQFDYPDNMTLTDAEKKEFAKKITKGKALYEMTCAKCHNKMVNGISTIPDFSLPQLMDYEMRIQYPSHQDRLSESNINAEELDIVVLFLRCRKKN